MPEPQVQYKEMDAPKNKHILIVEDSPDLQVLLARMFKAEGYPISQAYNGKEALEWLHSTNELPSLILLDIMMPVMDGIEFRQAQKTDPRLSSIPVVVMTADSNARGKTDPLGVSDFIRKPISDIDELFEIVDRLTG